MSKPVFSISALLDWAKSKDPKEEFEPSSGLHCALAQYGKFLGIAHPCGGTRTVYEMDAHQCYVIKGHDIIGLDSNAIYYKQYRDKDGNRVNNFGNFVEALENPDLAEVYNYGKDYEALNPSFAFAF